MKFTVLALIMCMTEMADGQSGRQAFVGVSAEIFRPKPEQPRPFGFGFGLFMLSSYAKVNGCNTAPSQRLKTNVSLHMFGVTLAVEYLGWAES